MRRTAVIFAALALLSCRLMNDLAQPPGPRADGTPAASAPAAPALALTQAAPGVFYAQDFNSPEAAGWPLTAAEDEFARTQPDLIGGAYRWRITALQDVFSWMSLDEPPELPAAYSWYAVTVRLGDAPTTIRFGLLFDIRLGGSLYYFQVSQDGEFALLERGDHFTPLLQPSPTTAVQAGPHAVNRLAVENANGDIALYANGQILGRYRLPNANGPVGWGVELSTGQSAALYFDDVIVCSVKCE